MKSTFLIIVILFAIISFSDINHAAEENAAEEEIDFGYVGTKGPAFWHTLTEESEICLTGKNQSPIDITSDDLKTPAEPPQPKFNNVKNVESLNNGNTVEISSGKEGVPLPAEITVEEEKYDLLQFHFHTPSEHRLNGKHFDIEQHLVFQGSETGKISVVAVLYNVGDEASPFMAPIVEDLPKTKDEKKEIKEIGLNGLLSDIKNVTQAFTYSGSLTTPPCTEGVTWFVNQEPLVVSVDQFSQLREVIGFNSRFTQLRANEVPPEGPQEEQPAEQPAEDPAKEPAKEPTEDPAKEPKEDPAKEPAKAPKEAPKEPAKEPVEEPKEVGTTDSYKFKKRSLYSHSRFSLF